MLEDNPVDGSTAKSHRPLFNDGHNIEALPPNARKAIWRLLDLLRSNSRISVFAIVGSVSSDLTGAVLALCKAKGGSYVRLSEYIGQQVSADSNFRGEWITAYYLAEEVMNLTDNCQSPFLVVDDWEVVLALIQHAESNAHLVLLNILSHQQLRKPVVLVFPIGPGFFANADEVRTLFETGGRSHVVVLSA